MEGARPERLYREPEGKKLAGVCGGLADYFGFDPTVVRLAFVVIGLASGFAAVVAYIVAMVVVPQRPDTVPRVQAPANPVIAGRSRNNVLLIGLLAVATVVMVGGEWTWWWFEPPIIGALLVGVGLWLLYSRAERPVEEMATTFTTPSDPGTTLVGEPEAAGPQDEVPPPIPPWGPAAPSSPYPPAPARPAPTPQPPGTPVGLLAALLIAAGVVALLAVFDLWDLDLEKGLGVSLLVVGAALVVGSWRRGWRPLLLGLGFPALVLLVLCDIVDLPLDGGVGQRQVTISSIAELRRMDTTQELLAGDMVLDLSEAPLDHPTAPRRVRVDLGLGNLEVRLPPDVTAELDIEVGIGGSQVDARDENGIDVDRIEILDGRPGGGRIELDLNVGLGEVEVLRA